MKTRFLIAFLGILILSTIAGCERSAVYDVEYNTQQSSGVSSK